MSETVTEVQTGGGDQADEQVDYNQLSGMTSANDKHTVPNTHMATILLKDALDSVYSGINRR